MGSGLAVHNGVVQWRGVLPTSQNFPGQPEFRIQADGSAIRCAYEIST